MKYLPVLKKSMRHEKLYLTDILEAADAIERFIAGLSKAEFINIVLYLTVDRCYLPSDKAT